jgi:outer membrane protein
MKNTLIGTAALWLVVAISTTVGAFAQKGAAPASGGMRIGAVDTRKIIEQLPEYKEAEEKMREVGSKYKDTLDTIQKDYIAALEAYDKQKNMMSAEAKAKQEESLQAIQQRYLEYREKKMNINNPQSDLGKLQEELIDPIRKRVRNAIRDVARDEKLSAVLEAPAFIYYDEQLDFTFRVIDKLKRNK